MKSLNAVFLAIVIAVYPLVGCASFKSADPYQRVELSLPYLRTSAMLIAGSVFNYAVSEEDREAKARIVYDIASTIEELTKEGDISVEKIGEIVSNYLPDKSHWDEFAANIILLYADVYGQTDLFQGDEKRQLLVKALNYIATGCKAAAKIYIPDED